MAAAATAQGSVGGDRAALLALYGSVTVGPSSRLPWDTNSTDFCAWTGISCDTGGRAVGLDLHNMRVRGSLPESIGELDKLEKLYLFSNEMGSSLPSSLSQLTSLTDLMLSENLFVGELFDVSRLRSLRYLDFSYNKLEGSLPAGLSLCTELGTVKGDYNQVCVIDCAW
jgi:LRR receptor-like serine/threonine-protein kinase FLS2